MTLEQEFSDLKLTKRQYDKLAREVLDRYHQKKEQEERDLEKQTRNYSIQELQEVLGGTGVSEEDIREVVKERFELDPERAKRSLKWTGLMSVFNIVTMGLGFDIYANSGNKFALGLGILNSVLLAYHLCKMGYMGKKLLDYNLSHNA